jgi:hypothetical protein
MEEKYIYTGLILSVIAGIIAAIIAWRVSNFFIARREFYAKSQYEILMKKLGWCFFWGAFVAFVGFSIVVYVADEKNKTNEKTGEFKNEQIK